MGKTFRGSCYFVAGHGDTRRKTVLQREKDMTVFVTVGLMGTQQSFARTRREKGKAAIGRGNEKARVEEQTGPRKGSVESIEDEADEEDE